LIRRELAQALGSLHTSVCCLVSFAGILSPCFQSSDAAPSLFSGQPKHKYASIPQVFTSASWNLVAVLKRQPLLWAWCVWLCAVVQWSGRARFEVKGQICGKCGLLIVAEYRS
jgi:hypothetical protein